MSGVVELQLNGGGGGDAASHVQQRFEAYERALSRFLPECIALTCLDDVPTTTGLGEYVA